MSKNPKPWFVYILECCDGSFYCGITNDLEKRMKSHIEGRGSKYVKTRGFKALLKTKEFTNRSQASKAEYYIKTLQKNQKLSWFNN